MSRRRDAMTVTPDAEPLRFEHRGRSYVLDVGVNGERLQEAVAETLAADKASGVHRDGQAWAAGAALDRRQRTGTERVFRTYAEANAWRTANGLAPLDPYDPAPVIRLLLSGSAHSA